MIYVRAELAPDAIRWAIRLSTTTAGFCSNCVGHCLQNMERGLNVFRDVPPYPWAFVEQWKLRQGKSIESKVSRRALERAMVLHQAQYRQARPKLKEFERALLAGEANLKVCLSGSRGARG